MRVGDRVSWKGEEWLVRSVDRIHRWVTLMKGGADLDKPEGERIPWSEVTPCD